MAKEEIVEGLRQAVSKGEPLNKAMMTFYNAGYIKEEIEEAARVMQTPDLTSYLQTPGKKSNIPPINTEAPGPSQNYPQRASNYEEKPKPFSALVIFVLVFFLLFLLGVLVAVFLFKDELTALFNSVL